MAALRRRNPEAGQALVEYVMIYSAIILPLTFMIIFTAQMMWVWNTVVEWTRNGARYAATHCAQSGGGNVTEFMRNNVPLTFDFEQFRSGPAEVRVEYFSRDPASGELVEYACGSDCSLECVPDAVKIRVTGYEFRAFQSYLGLPPIPVPEFATTVPIESAGCDPETGSCLP